MSPLFQWADTGGICAQYLTYIRRSVQIPIVVLLFCGCGANRATDSENGFGAFQRSETLFRADLRNSGVYAFPGPSEGKLDWTFGTEAGVLSSPVIAQGPCMSRLSR